MKKKKTAVRKIHPTKAQVAFITFVSAALIYLIQAILSKLGIASQLMHYAQAVVTVILFVLTGMIAWSYVKTKKATIVVLFLLAWAVIIASVILPIV